MVSPDLVLPDERIIIECKRTRTAMAEEQLRLLYEPVLAELLPGPPWRLVSACLRWAGEERPLLDSPLDARPGLNFYLHRP